MINRYSLMYINRILLTSFWIVLTLKAGNAFCEISSESDAIQVGAFSTASPGDDLPDGWRHLTFESISRHTRYMFVRENGRVVLKAVSEKSASGITKAVKIDPRSYPVIEWEWKVGNVISKGDVNRKKGDDYPARIFITFEYDIRQNDIIEKSKSEEFSLLTDPSSSPSAINYIWGSNAREGLIVASPFSNRVAMSVVRSGPENLNTWLKERRNVYQDYLKFFGKEPPMITGIVIMTDSDNTGESATACYSDITFKKIKTVR